MKRQKMVLHPTPTDTECRKSPRTRVGQLLLTSEYSDEARVLCCCQLIIVFIIMTHRQLFVYRSSIEMRSLRAVLKRGFLMAPPDDFLEYLSRTSAVGWGCVSKLLVIVSKLNMKGTWNLQQEIVFSKICINMRRRPILRSLKFIAPKVTATSDTRTTLYLKFIDL